jgi:hypothetical protein
MCVDVYGGSTTTLSFFFSFHRRHEIGIQSFTLHETNMTYNTEPNMHGCWGQYGCEVQSANVQKGIDWKKLIFGFIHHLRVQRQFVLVSLIFVPRFRTT